MSCDATPCPCIFNAKQYGTLAQEVETACTSKSKYQNLNYRTYERPQ